MVRQVGGAFAQPPRSFLMRINSGTSAGLPVVDMDDVRAATADNARDARRALEKKMNRSALSG